MYQFLHQVTLSSVILNTLACEWDLTLLEMALIPTLVILAALPGDFIGGYFSDRIGKELEVIGWEQHCEFSCLRFNRHKS